MTGPFIRKVSSLCIVALATLLVSGCAPSIDGKYEDTSGIMSVEIKGDKATISAPIVGSVQTDCKRDGDKVTLSYQNQPLVLTVKPDGSLEGPNMSLKKKP